MICITVTNMSQQPTQISSGSSGATAKSQGAPQTRTPVRVLLDLVMYTAHGLQIQTLKVEHGTLQCEGRMRLITQSFLNEVEERGWSIMSVTVGPQYTLEVVLLVDVAEYNTQATQTSGGVKGDSAQS